MAEVYKAKTVGIAGFEKIQALKRILPHSAREGRFIRSFIDEARIAVELTHRNIVQVFDFGKADGELFLAMELIEGKDPRTALADAAALRFCRAAAGRSPRTSSTARSPRASTYAAPEDRDVYGGSPNIVHQRRLAAGTLMLSNDGYVKILRFRDRARHDRLGARAAAAARQAAVHGARADVRRAADRGVRRVRARDHRVGAVHRAAAVPRAGF